MKRKKRQTVKKSLAQNIFRPPLVGTYRFQRLQKQSVPSDVDAMQYCSDLKLTAIMIDARLFS
jgi:hypothetical protein